MRSGDLASDLTLKNGQRGFMIFDALSIAAYRMSLRGPGAELDGGIQTPPTQPVRRRAPARSTYIRPCIGLARVANMYQ